ncbi:MAG: hypothetical protein IPH12_17460 [Saprospirales bacterium]|nr:hypothetical protein [Saprospirales bacterium]
MSTSDTFIRQIRDLIAGGKLDESLRLLRALLQNTPHLNEAIQQSGRYADICRQARLGTVGDSDATRTQNQIRLGVLELLSELERQGGEPGLDGLLVAMEEAGKRPELQQEVTKAISVVNSKNLVVASTIQAGSVHIGDNIYIGRPSDLSPESLSRQTTLQNRPSASKLFGTPAPSGGTNACSLGSRKKERGRSSPSKRRVSSMPTSGGSFSMPCNITSP